jgi:RNA polymerase sigma-70 factor (ECF subfamily)
MAEERQKPDWRTPRAQAKPDWRTPIEAILAAAKGAEQKIAEILAIARRSARRSLDRDQADDIAQEIAIKAWEQLQAKPESIDFSQPLPPLVHLWVGRTILDRLKSDRCRVLRGEQFTEASIGKLEQQFDPTAELERSELANVVAETLRKQPTVRREIWVQVHDQDFSYAEVAERRGISVKTVQEHLYRAQRAIRADVTAYLETSQ